jgi:hypothetical protein
MNSLEYSAFHYGFVASQMSAVLARSEQQMTLMDEDREHLNAGMRLWDDILAAEKLFTRKPDAAAASAGALEVFQCALQVVLSDPNGFGVSTLEELVVLFRTISDTLTSLSLNRVASKAALNSTRQFFQRLSRTMLASVASTRGHELVGQ